MEPAAEDRREAVGGEGWEGGGEQEGGGEEGEEGGEGEERFAEEKN